MSQGFEKETSASTAKSLLGALTALGSGFVFMFLALVALTASATSAQGDRTARPFVLAVQADILSLEPGSLQVSKDQKKLRFRTAKGEVVYQIVAASGEVARTESGQARKLVRLPGLSFSTSPGLLKASWNGASGSARASWALDRWMSKGKTS